MMLLLRRRRPQPLAITCQVPCSDRRQQPLFTAITRTFRIHRRRLKEARRPFIRRCLLSNMRLLQYKRRPRPLLPIRDVNSTSSNKMRRPLRRLWQRLRVAEDLEEAAAQAYMVFTLTLASNIITTSTM